jgi:hypothetical protein
MCYSFNSLIALAHPSHPHLDLVTPIMVPIMALTLTLEDESNTFVCFKREIFYETLCAFIC